MREQNGGRPMTDVCSSRRYLATGHAHHTLRTFTASVYVPAKNSAAARGNSGRRHPSSAYVANPMRFSMSRQFAMMDLLGI
jgi:hypothetical protein